MALSDFSPRSALFVPANRERAIDKAVGLGADLVIFDLEDAVAAEEKGNARALLKSKLGDGYGEQRWGVRLNAIDSEHFAADAEFVEMLHPSLVVLPKVEGADGVASLAVPIWVMIETPRGVLNAATIADHAKVSGLIAGTNDLAAELRLPNGNRRPALSTSLQMIVLAARAAGIVALDGVFNGLENQAGLETECEEGRALGFDGKTLIHPGQVEVCNRIFSPSAAETEAARSLISAASGGAQRHEGRMIEDLHVEEARRILARKGSVT